MITVTLTSTTGMARKGHLYADSGVIKLSDGTFTHVLHEKAFNCEIKEYVEPEIKPEPSIARNVKHKTKK